MLDFYQILQKIMQEKALSIPDVARISGLSDSTIRSILTRKSKSVALDVACKLAKGLQIPLEQLLGNTQDFSSLVTLTDEEAVLIKKFRTFDEKNQQKVLQYINDLDKDIKISAILLQDQRKQQAIAYGGKTASSILSEEQQRKLDELFKNLD